MSDRFDFLEFGDTKPRMPELPADGVAPSSSDTGWKPLRLRALEEIGEMGTRAGQFSSPTGLTVDRDGTLYVVDSNNHRVQRVTQNDQATVFGGAGSAPGQLWGPQAVAVDPTGRFLFVAEQGNHRVQCFDIRTGQTRGAMGGFRSPSGLTFDAEGMLWIADTGNGRLLRLNPAKGQFVGGMDRAAGIGRPIAVSADHAHNIYITDGGTNDVTCFSYAGVRGPALGETRRISGPRQTAVDTQGRIYVTESEANRLHVFDAAGQSLITFDTPSTRLGSFRAPSGIALGPNGAIYVADTSNHRIIRLTWE